MICTPAMDGKVCTGYANSYVYTILAGKDRGWNVSSQMLVFNSNISQARALISRTFMQSDADVMFSIDSDISWDVEGFYKVLEAKPDVVLGCYPKKQDELDFTPFGFGFVKITRNAIERMQEAYPELHANYIENGVVKHNLYMLYNEMIDESGMATGEDIAFFQRWRKIGGEVAVETDINFEHYGTKTYCGNLADHLRKETGNGSVLRNEYIGGFAHAN